MGQVVSFDCLVAVSNATVFCPAVSGARASIRPPASLSWITTPERSHSSAPISGLLYWPCLQNQSQIWLRRRWRLPESSRRRTRLRSTNIAPPPKIMGRSRSRPLKKTVRPSQADRSPLAIAPKVQSVLPQRQGYHLEAGKASRKRSRPSGALQSFVRRGEDRVSSMNCRQTSSRHISHAKVELGTPALRRRFRK